ncbi:class I SAM-dependent methyltransferase [Psychrobacter cryohalolentis]|uniref:Methyltransferase type 12 n=1 Tax=Psychrobacter cryohalolentis (strain ATCC BAA-1226 / DSM 17306 / VKM B-2378 / K5) TaxID=335284 RepID=Q1QC89_PSYCK|nr:class I SAM-dependent methyltransferase [Psychrobacter cryohalolentis]ABE74714.1 Methyltransferase type 12 [Psychrobacter cryohalolentis K5]ASE27327.1 class I SAM-dependent methyltransferase [Psychrobacter cryohalolentis]
MINQLSKRMLNYYDENVVEFACQTVSIDMHDLYELFINQLPQRDTQSILDVGCGSGRDASYFAKQGYEVTAIDASAGLIQWAQKYHMSSRISWVHLDFSSIENQTWENKFTGIWACASLLHVPFLELSFIIKSLLYTLTDKGVMYLSFKCGEGERVDNERFFCDMNESRWTTIVAKIPQVIEYKIWLSADKRSSIENNWFNITIKKTD